MRKVQSELATVGTIDSTKFVGGHVLDLGGTTTVRDLAYEVYGSRGIALVELRVIHDQGLNAVDALRIEPLAAALSVTHGFRKNLTMPRAIVLLLAIGMFAFTVGTAILVATTRMPRRWLWALVALVGTGQFTINWTTGAAHSQLLAVHLLGGSIFRAGLAGPWMVAFSFPIGAIVALRRRQQAMVPLKSISSNAGE